MSDEKPTPKSRSTRTTQNSVQPEKQEQQVPSVSYAESKKPTRVILGGDTDPVYASKIVPFNQAAKKSLSVRHLQFRLSELGYDEALVDNEGYYGEYVESAVARFQSDHDLQETGQPDNGTLSAVFDGDPNVTLHLA